MRYIKCRYNEDTKDISISNIPEEFNLGSKKISLYRLEEMDKLKSVGSSSRLSTLCADSQFIFEDMGDGFVDFLKEV